MESSQGEQDEDSDDGEEAVAEGESPAGESGQQGDPGPSHGELYKIFTEDYDEVVLANELCEPDELTRLRSLLDKHLDNLNNVIGKLANRLQRN